MCKDNKNLPPVWQIRTMSSSAVSHENRPFLRERERGVGPEKNLKDAFLKRGPGLLFHSFIDPFRIFLLSISKNLITITMHRDVNVSARKNIWFMLVICFS